MGDHHLPDELLSEILSPALKVTDDAFSDLSDVSPFASYSESTSAYLLVSKSWLRVATPLLYHVVVLRSKGQAAALGRALSQNEDLGPFIKKLRVEGGYGQPMHTILSRTPNVTDLYLYLDILSSDSTVGLCKGLCLVNPTRLIVKDDTDKPPSNKMAVNLFSALGAAIRKWEQLVHLIEACLARLTLPQVVFECTYVFTFQWEQRGAPLVEAFVEVQRLHTLVVDFAYQLDAAYEQLKACPLRTVRVKQKLQIWDDPICEDTSLLALLEYKPRDLVAAVEDAALPSELRSYPLENVSQDVQEAIWSRVSQFAFDEASHEEKIPFLLVSQTFYQAGFANCYETTLLESQSDAQCLLTLLEHHPDLISTFRSFAIVPGSRYRGQDEWYAEYGSLITTVGASLRTLCATSLSKHVPIASPDMFLCLNNLRTLEWGFRTTFPAKNMRSVFANALPQLECLILTDVQQSFLKAFSYASLPSLHTVKLVESRPGEVVLNADDFFIVHGQKLRDLKVTFAIVVETDVDTTTTSMRLSRGILELCPLLVDLVFMEAYSPPPPEVLACTSSAIEKISFTWSRSKFRDALKEKSRATQWETFFSTTPDPGDSLPHLREIHLVSIDWPITERDIAKNFWVGAAEKLLARTSGYASASERDSAVQTTDGSGKAWRPRLKAGRKRS